MKRAALTVLVLIIALTAMTVFAQNAVEESTSPYVTTLDEAKALAADGNKPIIIDFYTDWCVWCKKFDKEVAPQAEVIDYFTNDAVYAKINAEEDTLVSKAYKVMGFPTFVVANSKGEEYDRIAGYLEAEEFLQTVDDYINGIGTLKALIEEAKTNEDRELYFKIADKYKYSGWVDDANVWYDKVRLAGSATDSMSGEAVMAVADMYRRVDEDDKALETYEKIVKEFKGTDFEPKGMLYVGHMNRWAKDYTTAMNIYNTVMTKFEGKVYAQDAEVYRAINYRDKGDTAQAIVAFSEFITHWPESEDVEYCNEQIAKLRGE